jgi:hypothetical protein
VWRALGRLVLLFVQFLVISSRCSPEQARVQDADHRADIFSFGVIPYEIRHRWFDLIFRI